MTHTQSGSAVMLDDGLQAGFFVEHAGSKEFAAFEVPDGPASAKFVRRCTKDEKKKLNKLVYGEKATRNILCTSSAWEGGTILFVLR